VIAVDPTVRASSKRRVLLAVCTRCSIELQNIGRLDIL
jgi:hypothetical protein